MSGVLLAVETATEACSVGLWVEGETRVRHEVAPREHARLSGRFIEVLLAESGLTASAIDAIAVGRGPGSFTGVRIAISLVQGLALSLDRPVIPVSTLAVLGQGGLRRHEGVEAALVAIDARMGQVYWGAFARDPDTGLALAATDEAVLDPARVSAEAIRPQDAVAVGTGWGAHGAALQVALGSGCAITEPEALPHAEDLLALARPRFEAGDAVDAAEALPVYLRDQVASKPRPR